MKSFFSLLVLITLSISLRAQSFEKYFKELFYKVHISSTGDMLAINYYYNYRDELKVEFIKINSFGEIYFRKETTDVLPWYSGSFVSANDEIFIWDQNQLKRFNFNGDLLDPIYKPGGDFIQDNQGQFIVSGKSGNYDAKILKLSIDGQEIWSNFIPDCKNITKPLAVPDGFIVGLHRINEQGTDPIEFTKYNPSGEIIKTKQFYINDDIVGLHKTYQGYIATTLQGRLIALNNELDTLWTKKVSEFIEGSLATGNWLYIYQLEGGYFRNGKSGVTKIDFYGNINREYEKPALANFVRSVEVTPDDEVIMVCSTQVDGYRTILVKAIPDILQVTKEQSRDVFNIFPNPVMENNILHIFSQMNNATLSVFDQKGNKMQEVLINNTDVEFNHLLKNGLYFYQLEQNNVVKASGKIIVN
ncbi:MAG: T9SS type A sorting domain-containing protein [Sporocytophaga sp.]|uniref:T9SS type A sorting domain-containing protein n=1 Tax=Sporocytophaga sp. TaxID=2231183 RepID=UPI001B2877AB|nr:T9SS type A sorting domain-containing protein [Sporocytophaga sp.]MBO9699482.1 T9SS type A sorting domain-containing protein [Sporocytophaga sp.]